MARENRMRFTGARFIGSYPDHKQAPRGGLPEIAIGGRSNVGKSSLINSLVKRKKLAQISKTPGKTRLLNFFALRGQNGRDKLFLVDLPGYGYARVSESMRRSWRSLVEGYIKASRNLRGFILLVDSRRGVEDEEMQLVKYLLSLNKRICPVLTKSDKLKRSRGSEMVRETTEILGQFGENVCFPVLHSSKDGRGNASIWRWMSERISDES
jgi:GTP-binding protein